MSANNTDIDSKRRAVVSPRSFNSAATSAGNTFNNRPSARSRSNDKRLTSKPKTGVISSITAMSVYGNITAGSAGSGAARPACSDCSANPRAMAAIAMAVPTEIASPVRRSRTATAVIPMPHMTNAPELA